jgi:hypothetical protein
MLPAARFKYYTQVIRNLSLFGGSDGRIGKAAVGWPTAAWPKLDCSPSGQEVKRKGMNKSSALVRFTIQLLCRSSRYWSSVHTSVAVTTAGAWTAFIYLQKKKSRGVRSGKGEELVKGQPLPINFSGNFHSRSPTLQRGNVEALRPSCRNSVSLGSSYQIGMENFSRISSHAGPVNRAFVK